jgi:putative membrane protein (TIGR04086 family)
VISQRLELEVDAPPFEIYRTLRIVNPSPFMFYVRTPSVTLVGSSLGGFYAAYKAGTLEMKHGALVGVASILLGLVMHSGDTETQFPEWFMALSFAAAIPAGALGGFFAEMFKSATGVGRGRINPSQTG